MEIRRAEQNDLIKIHALVIDTIQHIYPRYYPQGAVYSFLDHHREPEISADIESKNAYVLEVDGTLVGTVTIKENMIKRLFLLPGYQGKGYGGELLEYAEKLILNNYETIRLETSLPAKLFYLKYGYKEVASDFMVVANGDILFWDVMEKNSER